MEEKTVFYGLDIMCAGSDKLNTTLSMLDYISSTSAE